VDGAVCRARGRAVKGLGETCHFGEQSSSAYAARGAAPEYTGAQAMWRLAAVQVGSTRAASSGRQDAPASQLSNVVRKVPRAA